MVPLAQEGAVQVYGASADPRITVHISLTSPVVREQVTAEGAGGKSLPSFTAVKVKIYITIKKCLGWQMKAL